MRKVEDSENVTRASGGDCACELDFKFKFDVGLIQVMVYRSFTTIVAEQKA